MHAGEETVNLPTTSLPARAAFWWSVLFGLVSLYWAAGGEIGISTLAQVLQDRAREGDGAMRLQTLVTGLLKIAGGGLALATIRPWGRRLPRRPLLLMVGGVGTLYALYGVLGFTEKVLMATGVIGIPDGFGEEAVVWYLVLWEPTWMLGGALFLLTAWRFHRGS